MSKSSRRNRSAGTPTWDKTAQRPPVPEKEFMPKPLFHRIPYLRRLTSKQYIDNSLMKKNVFSILMAFLASTLMYGQKGANNQDNNGQPVLVERITKPDVKEDLTIPYSKYKLANGLTVIVAEDHSDPMVHVDVTYHVGSAREEPGKSGFAHFFEHMMFQGSRDVANGQQFKIVTQAGGTMNGNTTNDRTRYFETMPKNYLETALWLESDRMGFLLDSVTQKKFEIQRATVKNEKAQRYDNRPYGRLNETTDKNFYPFGHPYSWPTIGYVPDLNRVGVEDLKKFFLRWYGPNNAVLTIGGDVNTFDVIQLVNKYFGSIPRGPEVTNAKPEYFNFPTDRYISMEDNVRFPMLVMTYPSVARFNQDEAALDLLAELIGGGKSSIIYKNFVKAQKAVNAYAADPTSELGGQFMISVQALPGTKLADMEALVRSSLKEFIDKGITDKDLDRVKTQREAEMTFQLESIANKVNILSDYQTYLGNPNYIRTDIDRYKEVTKKDLQRVFEVYIKDAHCVIASVYPKGHKELIAAPDNFTAGGDSSKLAHQNYDTLKPRTVKDNFKRNKQPKPGPTPVMSIPQHYTTYDPHFPTGNGIVNSEVPDVYVQINIKAGQANERREKAGLANLAARMMQESTYKKSAEEMSDEFEALGTDVNVSTNQEYITVTAHCLSKTVNKSIMLINEMITVPKCDPDEFARVKNEVLQQIANQSVRADALADNTFNGIIYGATSPFANSILGTKESVESITVEDVKAYLQMNVSLKNTDFYISGDVDQEKLKADMMLFVGWQFMISPEMPMPKPQGISKTQIYLVNKENAPQSEIRIGYLALPWDSTGDYYKANIMNYPLGGAFSSRLNLFLREKKGYTYGIRSFFSGNHNAGPFEVSAGVRADVTDSSVMDAMDIMKNYAAKGITKQELQFTKDAILGREALAYETNSQKVRYMERMWSYKLSDNYLNEQQAVLKKMKVKDVNSIAKQYLPTDKMAIVVVGDAKSLKDKLSKLGYPVVEVQNNSSAAPDKGPGKN